MVHFASEGDVSAAFETNLVQSYVLCKEDPVFQLFYSFNQKKTGLFKHHKIMCER